MEGIEFVTLKVLWGCDLDEALDELGDNKDKFFEYLKKHSVYDKERQESVFSLNCEDDYLFIRPYISHFPDIEFEIIFYAMESGQDLYGKCSWFLSNLDEDEDLPLNLQDIASLDEIVYPENWYSEWAENHEEETSNWRLENKEEEDDDYDFGADRWCDFADAFPEAKKEFFDYLEGL